MNTVHLGYNLFTTSYTTISLSLGRGEPVRGSVQNNPKKQIENREKVKKQTKKKKKIKTEKNRQTLTLSPKWHRRCRPSPTILPVAVQHTNCPAAPSRQDSEEFVGAGTGGNI
jgi:hypothetical protein